MHSVIVLSLYILWVFGVGAFIAPFAYHFIQWLASYMPQFSDLAQNPFHRFVHRSLLVLALLGLIPLLRWLKINSWRQVGLEKPFSWTSLGRGFLWGFFSLAVVVSVMIFGGSRTLRVGITEFQLTMAVIKAGIAALLVAPLEEVLFRGAIFGALRREIKWHNALVISSLIFCCVHFLGKPKPPENVDWNTGFIVLFRMLTDTGQWNIASALNLLLVGLILGWAFQNTGRLYFSIGLHAGWIFWLKISGFLTQSVSGISPWFWGTHKLIDGWLCFILLTTTWLLLVWRLPMSGEGMAQTSKHGVSK